MEGLLTIKKPASNPPMGRDSIALLARQKPPKSPPKIRRKNPTSLQMAALNGSRKPPPPLKPLSRKSENKPGHPKTTPQIPCISPPGSRLNLDGILTRIFHGGDVPEINL